LGDVASFTNGRAYKQDELLDKGKYRVLRVGNLYTNDSWYYSNMELDDKYYINKGDLIYTWSATFGPHIWDGERAIYHYHIWKVELSDYLDKKFATQLLEIDKTKLLSNTNGSTMVHITKNGMENKQVILPSITEQSCIGKLLRNLDQTITLHEEKKHQLEQLKSALLQKMFADKSGYPPVRFEGFSDEWEQSKLGDVCEEVSGNNGNVKGLPILTISAANGWMNQKDRFSQVIAGNELKKYTLLKKGHLAYNHGNSKQAKYGTVFVQNLYDQALVPRVYHSFKMKTENNPYYVEYYFATKKLDRELARLVTSGARMDGLLNINKKDFFKIKFEVPTPVEQSLISTILQALDQTITLHDQKLSLLKRVKQTLLQKMFI
jgi:restriction endonuclease S subunit